MKKEDVSGIVVYILILAIAVVFGITVLRTHANSSGMDGVIYMLFVLGAIIAGVLFNAILFELAHMVGARIGHYDVLSVNILGLKWYKDEDHKSHFKLSTYDGLTGETKILPKENQKKESNPTAYLLFGTVFYALEMIVFVTLFSIFTNQSNNNQFLANLGYFFLIMGTIGGMILVYNILPFHLDAMTDGYRLTMVGNATNKKAFNELLRVEHAVAMGETDVEVATFSEITNFTAELNLNKVYVLLDQKKFKEAEELLDLILAGKNTISEKVYIRARSQKIYINLITKSLDEAREYYDAEVPMAERRLISNDISMVSIRTYLLMSGLLDGSRSECAIAINNVRKCYKSTPKQRQKVEATLFNDAINRVNELHPTWGLTEYLIKYEEPKTKNKK